MIRAVNCLILIVFLVLGVSTLSPAARPNPMHPSFQLLDAQGKIIRQAGKEPDQIQTCGQCHDTAFIAGHNLPAHQQKNVSCLSCHFEGDRARLRQSNLYCRGLRVGRHAETRVAPDFQAHHRQLRQLPRVDHPSRRSGVDTQRIIELPLTRRAARNQNGTSCLALTVRFSPRRMLRLLSSISPANKISSSPGMFTPAKCCSAPTVIMPPIIRSVSALRPTPTAMLKGEPRREKMGEYLEQPDHRLLSANCQTCHDPQKGHAFLPYPARHFEVVACESCHVSRQLGPAERMVDATLLDESGNPLVDLPGIWC